jgi:hypothetical protein
MTRLFQNKPELMPGADNVLPQLANPIATTEEGNPLIHIGSYIYERERAELRAQQPSTPRSGGGATPEFWEWRSAWKDSLRKATWVSFTLSPADALELGQSLLRLVDANGVIREPRPIRVVKPQDE